MRVPPARSGTGMRGGHAGWHRPGLAFASSAPRSHRFPIHDVKQRSLLRSRGALLSAGFLSFRFASSARMRGGGAPERVTGKTVALARRNALPPVRREGASRRSTWRFSVAGPTLRVPAVPTGIRAATSPPAKHLRPADRVPRLPRPRFAPGPRDTTPRSALGASPETPLVSEDAITTTTSSVRSQLHFAQNNVVTDLNRERTFCLPHRAAWPVERQPAGSHASSRGASLISYCHGRYGPTDLR